jgi:Flp pilus assembly protein TadG
VAADQKPLLKRSRGVFGLGPGGMGRFLRSQRSQAIVEFAAVSPLLLLITFLAIDLGRLLYTYSAISSAARDGARIASLSASQYSDCYAIRDVELVGQGFPVQMDPNSLVGNSDPNNPAGALQPNTPPKNVGYAYIWPAVSTADPPDSNCDSNTQRAVSHTVKHVAVQVEYSFTPLTPLIFQLSNGFVVRTVSVVTVEY